MTSRDQLNNLITIGTFSKTLSASLRCGFIAARPDIIASLAELKMLTTVNSSGHVEQLMFNLINDGHYLRHLKRLGNRIRSATDKVVANLDRRGFRPFAEPSGGYYVYVMLPMGIGDIQFAKDASREGIFIAPGSVFNVEEKVGPAYIRATTTTDRSAQREATALLRKSARVQPIRRSRRCAVVHDGTVEFLFQTCAYIADDGKSPAEQVGVIDLEHVKPRRAPIGNADRDRSASPFAARTNGVATSGVARSRASVCGG
jgi:hypothetical protein